MEENNISEEPEAINQSELVSIKEWAGTGYMKVIKGYMVKDANGIPYPAIAALCNREELFDLGPVMGREGGGKGKSSISSLVASDGSKAWLKLDYEWSSPVQEKMAIIFDLTKQDQRELLETVAEEGCSLVVFPIWPDQEAEVREQGLVLHDLADGGILSSTLSQVFKF